MLSVRELSVWYGNSRAVDSVALSVKREQIVSLVGRNGAGKTSLLHAVMGLVSYSGIVELDGARLPRDTRRVVSSGVVLVPERRRIFAGLTVEENLLMGGYAIRANEIKVRLPEVYRLFPRLQERRRQYGGSLSGGEQQMLAIGRALMSGPRILLLDEPSLGLAPQVVRQVFRLIQGIKESGVGVLLVEQNVNQALAVSDYCYVLESGRITFHGKSADVVRNPAVRSAYLGVTRAAGPGVTPGENCSLAYDA